MATGEASSRMPILAASSAPRLELQRPPALRGSWPAVGALFLVLGLLAWLAARRVGPDWGWRWSRLLLAAAGLAWWLWLRPAPFGWILCLFALSAGALPAWRRVREPGSTLHVVAD
jgi:hypothetical protein